MNAANNYPRYQGDACLGWITSRSDRAILSYDRALAELQFLESSIIDTVMDIFHPAYLGPLPPSPRSMIDKAIYFGLVTWKEVNAARSRVDYCRAQL